MMKKYFYLMIFALMPMMFAACGDDDEIGGGSIPEELLGTWHCYDGGMHLSFTFNADGTGTGTVTFSGAHTYGSRREFVFRYGVKKNTVTCRGTEVYANTDGETSENDDWSCTFTLSGSTLTGGPYMSPERSTYSK